MSSGKTVVIIGTAAIAVGVSFYMYKKSKKDTKE
jgi:glutamate 5-kinase